MSSDDWPAIIARAEREGLRPIAAVYGVSQETIRATLLRAGRADLLADVGRRRSLEAGAPLPPPAPAKIPKERYAEVVMHCQRDTQANVAAIFGVSQMTIWRIVRHVTGAKRPDAGVMSGT